MRLLFKYRSLERQVVLCKTHASKEKISAVTVFSNLSSYLV